MWEKHGDVKIAKKLILYALYIIIIPVILYDVFLIFYTIINPGVTPELFGYKTFSIISGSMEPTLSVDDIVIIKKAGQFDIQKNDIITFKINDEVITHRVINMEYRDNKLIYTTQGDSNEVTDMQRVEYNQIEGKYVGKIPKLGKVFSIIKNRNIFISILIGLLCCYLLQRKSIARKIERKEKRERFERIRGVT